MNWVNDLGAPLAVTGVDLIVASTAPEYDEWAAYGLCGGAWLANTMGWARGDFVKNVAIAATPWAAKKLYERVRSAMGTPTASRVTARRVARYPAPLVEQPFGGARLV
jgi:hypothetical protein